MALGHFLSHRINHLPHYENMKFFKPLNAPAPSGAALTVRETINQILHGDCIEIMAKMPSGSVDFVLTDPPYITRYQSREGQTVINDDNDHWVKPSFAEVYRLMRPRSFCVSFYGWPKVDTFIRAWRAAGLKIVGHIVFRKRYASSTRFLRYQHEQAYLLAKGSPDRPSSPLADVIDWEYSGNQLHPTQKPTKVLVPLIRSFTKTGETVLDPFCGSGSTLAAAKLSHRNYVGIELDKEHHKTATHRLTGKAA